MEPLEDQRGRVSALVLVIGGWLGLFVRSGRIQRDAVAAIRPHGGEVWYEWEYEDGHYFMGEFHCPWPKWMVDHVGVDYLGNVIRVDFRGRGSDAELAHVGDLGQLEELAPHSLVRDRLGARTFEKIDEAEVAIACRYPRQRFRCCPPEGVDPPRAITRSWTPGSLTQDWRI